MTFKIHFEHADGTEDSVIVEGETIEEIREEAEKQIAARNGQNPWSEEL